MIGADLTPAWFPSEAAEAQADIVQILDQAPAEVPALLDALRAGRVDGSIYEGECACLLGTIANARGCHYTSIGIEPDGGRPAEAWFARIRPGHTPEINPATAQTVAWIEEWQSAHGTPAEAVSP